MFVRIGLLGSIAGIVLAAQVSSSAHAQHRVALVIGNDSYAHLDAAHQLVKAVNDANAVGDALARDGFEVIRGSDLSRSAMVDKLFDLTSRIQPGDVAFFYFAGHGVALSGGNYILPSDVPAAEAGQELRIASQSLAEADIVATLQEKGARVSIVVLDACRDNPFKRPGVRSIGLDRGLTMVHAESAKGLFSLYSAGFGEEALDRLSENDSNPNSVFTRVLVPLLTKPGLNLDDLAVEVREEVAALAATTADHHEQIPASYSQIVGGRVYLAGAPAPSPEIASAEPPGRVAGTEAPRQIAVEPAKADASSPADVQTPAPAEVKIPGPTKFEAPPPPRFEAPTPAKIAIPGPTKFEAPPPPRFEATAVPPASIALMDGTSARPDDVTFVQVASEPSEDEARRVFADLAERYRSILGARPHEFQRADLGTKGVYYRTRIGPLSATEGASLCTVLKAAGGNCVLGR